MQSESIIDYTFFTSLPISDKHILNHSQSQKGFDNMQFTNIEWKKYPKVYHPEFESNPDRFWSLQGKVYLTLMLVLIIILPGCIETKPNHTNEIELLEKKRIFRPVQEPSFFMIIPKGLELDPDYDVSSLVRGEDDPKIKANGYGFYNNNLGYILEVVIMTDSRGSELKKKPSLPNQGYLPAEIHGSKTFETGFWKDTPSEDSDSTTYSKYWMYYPDSHSQNTITYLFIVYFEDIAKDNSILDFSERANHRVKFYME